MAVSVSIVDVAAYILARESTMVTLKLHKLAFYAQAAHLVRHASPLFPEDFHAWVVGPVSPELYRLHRGKLLIRPGELPSGNPSALTDAQRALIDHGEHGHSVWVNTMTELLDDNAVAELARNANGNVTIVHFG